MAVSEEQKAAITRAITGNYKAIAEFDTVKTKLETERDDLKGSLTAAGKGANNFYETIAGIPSGTTTSL